MEEVIESAQQGDAEALGHLWRAYNHMLLRYFRGKGMAEPEDLASKVWVEVASSLPRFEGGEDDFRRWLFTIAARRRIDDIRASKRRSAFQRRTEPAYTDLIAPDASEGAEDAMALDRALSIISTLPEDQAEAVLLRVVGDLSVADVAVIMGRLEGNVRVLVHRGLKRLSTQSAVTQARAGTMSPT